MDVLDHLGQHQNSPSCPEKASNIDHEGVNTISPVAPRGEPVPSSEEMERTQNTSMTYFGVYTDEPVVRRQLLASHSGPPRSTFDDAGAQQPSPVDDDLPLLPNPNTEVEFTSYAIDFLHTLDDDARLAFGLLGSPQQG
jgi:hypothetical protein